MRTMLTLLAVSACTDDTTDLVANPATGDLHAVGDSIMAWFSEENASIADVLAETRGQTMVNASRSSALVTVGEPELPSIPAQYQDGEWSWLVVNGGGNDLGDLCGCSGCDAVLDSLVTADGRGGALPAFVGPVAASGVRVAMMGYPDLPDDAAFGLGDCDDEFETLATRLDTMASFDERITFVDMRDIISSTDLDMYDDDHVHPSRQGAAAMGAYLAEKMAELER